MLKSIQRFLTITILVLGLLYLGYEAFLYSYARELLPQSLTVAGLDLSGMSRPEAAEVLNEHYLTPLIVYYQDERTEVPMDEIGFQIDVEGMLDKAAAVKEGEDYWRGFLEFLLQRSIEPTTIELQAAYDQDALIQKLETIASFLDKPAKAPQLLAASTTFRAGEAGYVMNLQASLPSVETALLEPDNREAHLVIDEQAEPSFSIDSLRQNIVGQLDAFSGMGSVFVMDLETGEEMGINADVAMSGLSILKILIFMETYRVLDNPPDEYVTQLLEDTAVHSSNYGANLLLHVIAGENNTYKGADIITESAHRLGLVNTFMAVPYDATAVSTRPSTYTTPANSRPDLPTRPDSAMQTTAEEMGTLLSMIYYCAKGGGTLLAVYPDQITPDECQAIIDLMVRNEEGNLIRYGVPENVPVSHKHGWDFVTHGDAGIVLSPEADYVIVEYVTTPDSDWLPYEIGFPILREISRATYNYFNFDHPNLEDPEVRSQREAEIRAAATATAIAESAAADAAATAEVPATPEAAIEPTVAVTATPTP
ncbi:MAG: serine hydrolase [Ardenticatenaceae bacterium]|nr:serine hydrolase [Ardenticatenaceae bacterium]MCB9445771.1 serine hydrolase [Ardenticatenaceae bacterium]